jgi:16S rRNA (guanine527-N7)-methyltransferase
VTSPLHDAVAVLNSAIALLTGRPPAQQEMMQFRLYLGLLLAWNRTHRLTGHRLANAIVQKLFLDSLLFLTQLPHGRLTMVDIGTGPGIPGVPLRIVRPEISLTLIDSRRKQVSFLTALKRELNLTDLVVLEGRAEEIVTQHAAFAEAFDVVVMRAVGMRLLPTVMLYLKPGGLFVVGGPPAPRSARAGADGVPQLQCETVSFPGLNLSRTFLLARKQA